MKQQDEWIIPSKRQTGRGGSAVPDKIAYYTLEAKINKNGGKKLGICFTLGENVVMQAEINKGTRLIPQYNPRKNLFRLVFDKDGWVISSNSKTKSYYLRIKDYIPGFPVQDKKYYVPSKIVPGYTIEFAL